MSAAGPVVPLRFDLSALVRRSVATLYSHLVTRPTGQALRLGIESQIGELGEICVSVLDFSQVVVLDYSCADEAVAKLIRRFQPDDRPADAYFVALGVDHRHLDTLEAVLERHGLALVTQLEDGGYAPIGSVDERGLRLWQALEHSASAALPDLAGVTGLAAAEVASALDDLVRRRLVVRRGEPARYFAISSLLASA